MDVRTSTFPLSLFPFQMLQNYCGSGGEVTFDDSGDDGQCEILESFAEASPSRLCNLDVSADDSGACWMA